MKITQKLKQDDSELDDNAGEDEKAALEESKGSAGGVRISDRKEKNGDNSNTEEERYATFMDSLVPVAPATINAESGRKPIGEEVDLSRVLQKLETAGATAGSISDAYANMQVLPVSIDELSEPDDEEIAKMILTDEEKALKTRLWNTLNQDWICQEREKKKARKA